MGKKLTHDDFILRCKERDDFDEYEILTEYKSAKEKITVKHKCCNSIYEIKANNFSSNKQKCAVCHGGTTIKGFDWGKYLMDTTQGEYCKVDEYINAKTLIKIKHSTCNHTYEVRPSDFKQGYRCPYCAKNKKLTFEMLCERVAEIDSNYEIIDNDENRELFENVHSVIMFHNKEKDLVFPKSFNNFRNGQRENKEDAFIYSKATSEIKNYLNNKNIEYRTEITFSNLLSKRGRRLRIDFYIPSIDTYIEYNGKQHYIFGEKGYFTKEKFDILKENDELKYLYCKENNLNLVQISYKDDHIQILEELLDSTTN